MQEYNWKKEKQSMRSSAVHDSETKVNTLKVAGRNHFFAKFFFFVLVPVLLISACVWFLTGNRSKNAKTGGTVTAKAGGTVTAPAQDSAKALAEAAEKNRQAVGLVVLCIESKNGAVFTDGCGTAWAISQSQFVSNAHVILGLQQSVKALRDFYCKRTFAELLKKHKMKTEQEFIKKFGEVKHKSEQQRISEEFRRNIKQVYAEVRINGENKKRYRITHIQIHPDYSEQQKSADLGLVTIDGAHDTWFKLASPEKLHKLKAGEPIAYLGFPMENLPGENVDKEQPIASMQAGIVVAVSDFSLKDRGKENNFWIRHNLPAAGGASGSPIFNTEGNVVAVNKAITVISNTRQPSAAMINFGVRVDLLSRMGNKISAGEFLKIP